MAVRFGVIFITDNYTMNLIFTRKLITDCLLGLSLLLAILTTLFDIDNKTKKLESCFRDAIKHPFYCFLQTLKIQKSPMKKFHFRHQKIIHHYIKYMDILKEK